MWYQPGEQRDELVQTVDVVVGGAVVGGVDAVGAMKETKTKIIT